MKFRFGSDFVVDSDVEPWRREGLRIAMLGGPGSGKSWNNSLLAEQFLQQGGTDVIFQPRDEYFTLKEKFDVLSVGGVHAKDMEFGLTSPSLYAKAVVEDGISMVFYTSAVDDEQKLIDWVSRFIAQILKLQETHRRPLLLILEEAHEYTPRSPSGHIAPPWVYNRMIKAFKDCFTQGRKLNIIAIASSQRPQELNFTIRQLAASSLTFYGKFGSQDIKYIESECLKYIRKQFEMKGNEVIVKIIDASRLLDLKLGEWLVIMGKQTRFITVTQPRITKHGAETPRLEYVAPRPTEAKKTIDQLAKSILAALEKEQAEKSDLEKAKREISNLKSQIEMLQEKANIKLAVKEMLTETKPVGAAAPSVAPLSKEDKESKEKLETRVSFLESVKKDFEQKIKRLEEELKLYDDLKSVLRRMFPEGIGPHPFLQQPGEKTVGLQTTTTIVDVPPAVTMVTINTESMRGKVLFVAKKGKLDTWRQLGEIVKAIEEEHWNASPQEVNNALNDLAKEELITKKHTDRNYYTLANGVKFKEA